MAPAVEVRQLRPGDQFHYEWNPAKVAEVLSIGTGSATVLERRGRKHVVILDPHDKGRIAREFDAEDRSKPYGISLATRVHPAGRDSGYSDPLNGED